MSPTLPMGPKTSATTEFARCSCEDSLLMAATTGYRPPAPKPTAKRNSANSSSGGSEPDTSGRSPVHTLSRLPTAMVTWTATESETSTRWDEVGWDDKEKQKQKQKTYERINLFYSKAPIMGVAI